MSAPSLPQRPAKAQRVQGFGTTVFTVWSQLARKLEAINLGQGFPDFEPPAFVLEAGRRAMEGYQQYSPLAGMPRLREAVAHTMREEMGREIDVEREITVTVGATEGIYTSITALVNPGDEVVLLEPFYDSYPASITMAGGIPRYVPLRLGEEGDWTLDLEELRSVLNDKTRMLIVNTPNNPTGKRFTREELQGIADLCHEFDLYVLADEVYDRLVFDGQKHIPIASLPGMWERTITLRSVGKTFSVTGWKIGWAVASPALSEAIRMAHQWIPFSTSSPFQNAMADVLLESEENGYYDDFIAMYQSKRDKLVTALRSAGLKPVVPEGTYFVMANTADFGFATDDAFCQHLAETAGVVAIPPGSFYSPEHRHLAYPLARFAFCKRDEVLDEAAKRLQNLRG